MSEEEELVAYMRSQAGLSQSQCLNRQSVDNCKKLLNTVLKLIKERDQLKNE